jgi:RimJ/RimL family protein N-acetyltransferase
MLILQTKRLDLRHFEPGDLDALYAMYRDPEVRRYFPDGTRTLEETREELEWHRHGHPRDRRLGLWAAVERASGVLVGRCGLLPWNIDGAPEVELAYLIAKEQWGEGLATEAANGIVRYARETLGLKRLISLITHGNVASARVAEKVGMAFEREYADEFGPCLIYSRDLTRVEEGGGGTGIRTRTSSPG